MAYMYRIEIVNDKVIETEPSLEYPITMLQVIQDDSFRTWRKYIPAWSLHRLLLLLDCAYVELDANNPFEDCITRIEFMIKESKIFNKDYQEEKK